MQRKTKETDISLELEIYGSGKSEISTGIGFFDHMLEAFCKHAIFDMKLVCKGDLHVDFHHSVEDVGIVIGQALREKIYPLSGVERFGEATVVMDEAAVNCALDLSNRPCRQASYQKAHVCKKPQAYDRKILYRYISGLHRYRKSQALT